MSRKPNPVHFFNFKKFQINFFVLSKKNFFHLIFLCEKIGKKKLAKKIKNCKVLPGFVVSENLFDVLGIVIALFGTIVDEVIQLGIVFLFVVALKRT